MSRSRSQEVLMVKHVLRSENFNFIDISSQINIRFFMILLKVLILDLRVRQILFHVSRLVYFIKVFISYPSYLIEKRSPIFAVTCKWTTATARVSNGCLEITFRPTRSATYSEKKTHKYIDFVKWTIKH